MVAAAKLEREAVEKKNEQLRSQIRDTESLFASQQDQLSELKAVIEGLSPGNGFDAHTNASTAPSSPLALHQPGSSKRSLEAPEISERPPSSEELLPGPATSFSHHIKSVCRTDIPAYEDFRDLFALASRSKPPSRAGSGSYGGLNVMNLANFAGHNGGTSAVSSPVKTLPQSPNGSMSSPQFVGSSIPLKETRFYKRALNEDIEPTLRLDAAPGISWLTRRNVLSGICEGSLIVEPMPQSAKRFNFSCSLCGDRRSGGENDRTHRFRTSESDTAQRYPLCVLCLEKVRSCCEYTGYLRLILDGHIRVGDTQEEKDAWEETVRLRERMFWSRIGGGVLPLFLQANDFDKCLPDNASRASVYSEKDLPPPPVDSLTVEKDADQESITEDDAFMSAASDSSASSEAGDPTLDKSEPERSADTEVPERPIDQSTNFTIVNDKGEVNTEIPTIQTSIRRGEHVAEPSPERQ